MRVQVLESPRAVNLRMSRVLPFALLALSASAKFTAEFVTYGSAKDVETDVNIPPAEVSLPFTGKSPRSAFKKHVRESLRAHFASSSSVAPLAGSGFDEEYLVNITVGGQHFPVIVDTGRYRYTAPNHVRRRRNSDFVPAPISGWQRKASSATM